MMLYVDFLHSGGTKDWDNLSVRQSRISMQLNPAQPWEE